NRCITTRPLHSFARAAQAASQAGAPPLRRSAQQHKKEAHMRTKVRTVALTLLTLLLLSVLGACGQPAGPGDLFVEENAWTTSVPADATMIGADEFRRMVGAGQLTLRSTADVDDQVATRAADFSSNRALLAGLTNPSANVTDLLAATADASAYSG